MSLGGLSSLKNMGAGLEVRAAGHQASTGAAPVALTGTSIDRIPTGGGDASPQEFESCKLVVLAAFNTAVGVDVELQLDVEHADGTAADPSIAGAFSNVPTTHLPSTASATQTLVGTGALKQQALVYDLRLVELKRHVRFSMPAPVFTGAPGAGDVLQIQNVVIAGGAHKVVTRTPDWIPDYEV